MLSEVTSPNIAPENATSSAAKPAAAFRCARHGGGSGRAVEQHQRPDTQHQSNAHDRGEESNRRDVHRQLGTQGCPMPVPARHAANSAPPTQQTSPGPAPGDRTPAAPPRHQNGRDGGGDPMRDQDAEHAASAPDRRRRATTPPGMGSSDGRTNLPGRPTSAAVTSAASMDRRIAVSAVFAQRATQSAAL